jgi:hypothetical protein
VMEQSSGTLPVFSDTGDGFAQRATGQRRSTECPRKRAICRVDRTAGVRPPWSSGGRRSA